MANSVLKVCDLYIFIGIIYFATVEAVGHEAKRVNSTGQLNSEDAIKQFKKAPALKVASDARNNALNRRTQVNRLINPRFAAHELINKLDHIKRRKTRRELERTQEPEVEEYSTLMIEPTSAQNQRDTPEANSISDQDYLQESAGSGVTIEEVNAIDGSGQPTIANDTAISLGNQDNKQQNNDVEKLVRTQVDMAATNWATSAPSEHLPHLNDYHDNLQGSASQHELNTREHKQHPLANHRMDDSYMNKFYPNHNYKFDSNLSNPFWQLNQQEPPGFGSTVDPLATLSDGSNKYGSLEDSANSYAYNQYGYRGTTTPMVDLSKVTQNHLKQLRYMYLLRGPVTNTSPHQPEVVDTRPSSTPKPAVSTRSHPTVSPTIMKTFERLDGMRSSSQERHDSIPSTRIDLTKVIHSKTSNDDNEFPVNGLPVHNLFSNLPGSQSAELPSDLFGGKISSKGFMDGPIWEGDQQIASSKDVRPPTAEQEQSTQHKNAAPASAANESSKTVGHDGKSKALILEYHHSQRSPTSTTKANSAARAHKAGNTKVRAESNQKAILPTAQVTKNLNGSLAARLNANRYKSKLVSNLLASTVTPSSNLFYTPVEPLTINLKKIQNPTRKLIVGSTSNLPGSSDTVRPSATTSTTAALQMELPVQRGHTILIQADSPVKSTTARLPGPSSTYPTIAPNMAPALYAAAINNLNNKSSNTSSSGSLAASSMSYTARPAHHHHLHSHVHSIKPAFISIPIPIQPKFGAYESVLAAAAAAAAASASATRARLGRKPFIVHPMQPSVPRLQATRPAPRKVYPIPIPIGGTLASTRTIVPKMVQDQSALASYQSPSILANLLDSANKALKQVVTGNKASLLSLQAANNHQERPVVVPKKAAAFIYPHLYTAATKQRESGPDFLSLPMYSVGQQEHESFDGPSMESIGLYQAPPLGLNSDSSPVYSYLEDLLSAVPPDSDYLSNQTTQYESILPILNQHESAARQKTTFPTVNNAQNIIDWDQNSSLHSSGDSGDNVIFASLGGDSNILYPIISPDKSVGSDQYLVSGGPLSDQSSNMLNAFDVPIWGKQRGRPQTQQDNPISGRAYKAKVNNSMMKEQQSGKTKGRPHSATAALAGKLRQQSLDSTSHEFDRAPMQYALSHYAQDNQANGGLLYDAFDKSYKYPYATGLDYFATPDTMDGFQPISQPSYYYNLHPGNGSSASSSYFDSYSFKTGSPNMVNPSNHQPVVHAHDLTQQDKTKKATNGVKFGLSQRNPGQTVASNQHNSNKELYQQHSNHFQDPTATHLIQFLPHHGLYPASELMHHAMLNAGSSIKPHIVAASDLLNYHKQHLIDHHYMHHHYQPNSAANHHQDMVTSESARLGVSSPVRGSLLAHFWPLALAMIPIMIVVAILAQLVMTAPLVMFAMTTLTVSRLAGTLFGPLTANREEGSLISNIDSILSGQSLSNNTLAKFRQAENGTTTIASAGAGDRRRRKRRDLRG